MATRLCPPSWQWRNTSRIIVSGLLAVAVLNLHAQEKTEASGKPLLTIIPRLGLTETLTNNVALSGTNPQSEQITEISPGVRLQIDGARIKTYLDYTLTGLAYANGTSARQSQNALNAFGTIEAIDNRAFVEFSGNISQQTISALGTQSLDSTTLNANRAEVATYRVSPYLKGQVANLGEYEARFSRSVTSSDAQAASGSATSETMVKFTSSNTYRGLGWSADLGRQSVSYSQSRLTTANHFNVGPRYTVSSQVLVYAKVGREANNYTTEGAQNYNSSGVGLIWLPSPLSSVTVTRQHRSFGDAYDLALEHRSARTVWKFTDAKDVVTTPVQNGAGSMGSMYDLLFSQFASIEPDPVARAKMVETYLQTNGISASASAVNGFLTSAVSLQHRQELSFALLGLRDTITFIATRSESSRLDSLSVSADNLANSGVVHQDGLSLQYAHRLTPDYALGLLYSWQKTASNSNLPETNLRSLNVNLTGKLGKRSAVSLSARRTVVDGDTSPYAESAVIGNINVQF